MIIKKRKLILIVFVILLISISIYSMFNDNYITVYSDSPPLNSLPCGKIIKVTDLRVCLPMDGNNLPTDNRIGAILYNDIQTFDIPLCESDCPYLGFERFSCDEGRITNSDVGDQHCADCISWVTCNRYVPLQPFPGTNPLIKADGSMGLGNIPSNVYVPSAHPWYEG
jgi:hypothetical protein